MSCAGAPWCWPCSSSCVTRRTGYSLKKLLSDKGLEIDEGTLYPLLRRLESQGLLKSAWRVEDGRPRRYYQVSAQGETLAKELAAEWRALAGVIGKLIG